MKFYALILQIIFFSLEVYAQSFSEAAKDLGIDHSYGKGSSGGGVSFYDFDGDGFDDITLASQENRKIYFYKNNQGSFELLNSLVSDLSEVKQVLWADYDNDGDKDLFTTSFEDINRLYNNDGDFNMSDVTEASGLSLSKRKTFGAAWADVDNDGWLDLYVTNKLTNDIPGSNNLYRNNGDGTFLDIAIEANALDSIKRPFSISFIDINNDLFPDIYIAQDKKAINTLLKNTGDGTFEDVSISSNANLIMDGMCVAAGDVNNSGFMDIYITNLPEGNKLLINNGDETFTESAEISGVAYHGYAWGSNFMDYDNDGDLDLYVSGMLVGSDEVPSLMYTNDGSGHFDILDNGFKGDTVESYSNAIGDINNDGYADIIVNNVYPFNSMLWVNSGGQNNWLKVELEGVDSNRDGIGSCIIAYTGSKKTIRYTQSGIGYLGQNSASEMIGIGKYDLVDSIEIKWPSGNVDRIYNLKPNQKIKVIENSTILPPVIYNKRNITICSDDSILLETGFYKYYLWSTGAITRKLTIKESGDYFVRVEDMNGDSAMSDTITVKVIESPKLHIVTTPSDSPNGNGAIEVEVLSGKEPYSYQWIGFNNQTENKMTGLYPGNYSVIVTDSTGCNSLGSGMVESITGMVTDDGDFLYYPNPFHDFLEIEWGQGSVPYEYLEIFNLSGKIQYSGKRSFNQSARFLIDLSHMEAGLYILKLTTQEKTSQFRIIKK